MRPSLIICVNGTQSTPCINTQYSLRKWSNTCCLTLREQNVQCHIVCVIVRVSYDYQISFFFSPLWLCPFLIVNSFWGVYVACSASYFSQYYFSTYMDKKSRLYRVTLLPWLQLIRLGVVPAKKLTTKCLLPRNFSWGRESASQSLCWHRSPEKESMLSGSLCWCSGSWFWFPLQAQLHSCLRMPRDLHHLLFVNDHLYMSA